MPFLNRPASSGQINPNNVADINDSNFDWGGAFQKGYQNAQIKGLFQSASQGDQSALGQLYQIDPSVGQAAEAQGATRATQAYQQQTQQNSLQTQNNALQQQNYAQHVQSAQVLSTVANKLLAVPQAQRQSTLQDYADASPLVNDFVNQHKDNIALDDDSLKQFADKMDTLGGGHLETDFQKLSDPTVSDDEKKAIKIKHGLEAKAVAPGQKLATFVDDQGNERVINLNTAQTTDTGVKVQPKGKNPGATADENGWNKNLTGSAFLDDLKTKDPALAAQVQALDEGRYTGSKRNAGFQRVSDALAFYNPDAAPDTAEKLRQSYVGAGAQGKSNLSLATATRHADEWSQAMDKLGNGDMPTGNALVNFFKKQGGNADVTPTEITRLVSGTEIARAIQGPGPLAEKQAAEWQSQFDNAKSPAQKKAAITTALQLMHDRAEEANNAFNNNPAVKFGEKYKPMNFIGPEANKVFAKYGIGDGSATSTTAPTATPAATPSDAGKVQVVGW